MPRFPPELQGQPWLGWLLVCLARQRLRQAWLMEVQRTHLAGLREPDGPMPGLPGWTYELSGDGLCLWGPGRERLGSELRASDPQGRLMAAYPFANRALGRPGS